MKITVSRNELQAALLFASTDDSRYTLNSVCIQVRKRKTPILVGTDGRRLAVINTVAAQAEGEEFTDDHELLLTSEFARAICSLSKALGGGLHTWILFEHVKGSRRLSLAFIGVEFFMTAEKNALVEGTYPDWQKVLPPRSKATRTPISEMGINAAFVGDFARAAKLLGASSPAVQMNLVGKESAVEVRLAGIEHFYGLVMQCKCDDEVDYQPEFVSIVKNLPVIEPSIVAGDAGEEH